MTSGPEPVDKADAIRRDIEQTRAELADTVDALSDKLNVKKQATDKVNDVRTAAVDKVDEAKVAVDEHRREVAIGGAIAAAIVAIVLFVRWRRSR